MVATLQAKAERMRDTVLSLELDRFSDGYEPEAWVVYSGLSWVSYFTVDQALGGDRAVPQIYYLDGDLKIVSTSDEHKRVKKWFAGHMDLCFDELNMVAMPRGQATMQLSFQQAAAESDES